MIEAKDVSLRYPDGTTALTNISLRIEPGEIVYITGPSGSGKTSFLKLLMGIEYPSSGSLQVLGQTMSKDQAAVIRQLRMQMGPVFQEFKLIKGRTALENVVMGMRFLGLPTKQIYEDACIALAKVGLEHKSLAYVENLSWGETQRVAIARAIARKPALILADEPTGNLDVENALNIMGLLTSLKDEKTAIIITTHATHLIDSSTEGKLLQMETGSICWERLGSV